MKQVNALGDQCPLPVVKTKQAIQEMTEDGIIQILVDNAIAVQNLEKMAAQKGYKASSYQIEDNKYQVELFVSVSGKVSAEAARSRAAQSSAPEITKQRGTLVMIGSDQMGAGPDELGRVLMKGFLFALTKQEELPDKIIFYNKGAKLTCEASESLNDLSCLKSQGVEILTCGTCLNYQNLDEKLKVGEVTNMYAIAEAMLLAGKIIQP